MPEQANFNASSSHADSTQVKPTALAILLEPTLAAPVNAKRKPDTVSSKKKKPVVESLQLDCIYETHVSGGETSVRFAPLSWPPNIWKDGRIPVT